MRSERIRSGSFGAAMTHRTPDKDYVVVVVMLAVMTAAAALTLGTISERSPIIDLERTPDISRLGYTVSLLLFLFPSLAVAIWFARASHFAIEQRAFLPAFLTGFLFGVLLDVGFGNTFFEFRNLRATLGVLIPGWAPGRGFVTNIPVEEFLFYAFGFLAILLIYIWANLYWFGAYCADDVRARSEQVPRLVRPHVKTILIAFGIVLLACAWKYLGPHSYHRGFPGYLTFLVLGGALPAMLFFPVAKPFINWRAFSFTLFVLLFISLLWEVTLGVPYAWWGYRDTQMAGIFIEAWGHLPIEAVLVWIAAAYGAVITYETIRIRFYMPRSFRHAFLGAGPAKPGRPPAPSGAPS